MRIFENVQKFEEYETCPSVFEVIKPKLIPIAPVSDKMFCNDVKRYNCKSNPYTGAQAASIARRNARERNRVKQVNDGFNALRKKLPSAVIAALSGGPRRGSGKKLSKVDTLRMVVEYIRYLERMIDESDAELGIVKQPASTFTGPFLCEDDDNMFENAHYSEPLSPPTSECSSLVSTANSPELQYDFNKCYNVNQSSYVENEHLSALSYW